MTASSKTKKQGLSAMLTLYSSNTRLYCTFGKKLKAQKTQNKMLEILSRVVIWIPIFKFETIEICSKENPFINCVYRKSIR